MKRVIVTSKDPEGKGFTGAIELIYGELIVGTAYRPLLLLDMRGANLNDRQLNWVVDYVPRYYDGNFKAMWGTANLNITDADVEYDFEADFWKPYDNKQNKDRALKAWERLSQPQRAAVVAGMHAYLRYLQRVGYRAKMAADRFIRERHYLTDWDNLNS